MKNQLFLILLLAITFTNYRSQVVSTFAGSGFSGSVNAIGAAASFNNPFGVCSDPSGNIYVADNGNHKIRKITPTGLVTTFAGSGLGGSTDGLGAVASFSNPTGVCSDASGNIYVADNNNHKIRKISPIGLVTTLAGSGTIGAANATGTLASFYNPTGVCSDANGNIYVADNNNNKIRKITPAGVVTTLAGSGSIGAVDAVGTLASFHFPYGLCSDGVGNIYVADSYNHKIRKITSTGTVTNLAGSGNIGAVDATGILASFAYPISVSSDAFGNVYVADFNNHKIRKITTSGTVTTFAGSGTPGAVDAIGVLASFSNPAGICLNPVGDIYIADAGNHKIREITLCVAPSAPTNTTNISNTQICFGNSTTLSAISSGTINWYSTPTGGSSINTGVNFITSNTLSVGSYSYYAEATTCTNSASRTLISFTINALPIVTVNSGSICSGQSFTITPNGANTYTFQGGSAIVNPTLTTSYTIVGTSTAGCISQTFATSSLTVYANPIVTAVSNASLICIGQTTSLTAGGAISYSWSTGGSSNIEVVTPTVTTIYTVTGIDLNGCSNVNLRGTTP
ncbi:MAG: hypothetical protein H0W73_17730 [Bacteroidetes bacterium]|nr:hypothetical protein [Bacteroidota bacterium]